MTRPSTSAIRPRAGANDQWGSRCGGGRVRPGPTWTRCGGPDASSCPASFVGAEGVRRAPKRLRVPSVRVSLRRHGCALRRDGYALRPYEGALAGADASSCRLRNVAAAAISVASMGEPLTSVRERVASVRERVASVRARVASVRVRVAAVRISLLQNGRALPPCVAAFSPRANFGVGTSFSCYRSPWGRFGLGAFRATGGRSSRRTKSESRFYNI